MNKKGSSFFGLVIILSIWVFILIGLTYFELDGIKGSNPYGDLAQENNMNSFTKLWKIMTWKVETDMFFISMIIDLLGLITVAIGYYAFGGA